MAAKKNKVSQRAKKNAKKTSLKKSNTKPSKSSKNAKKKSSQKPPVKKTKSSNKKQTSKRLLNKNKKHATAQKKKHSQAAIKSSTPKKSPSKKAQSKIKKASKVSKKTPVKKTKPNISKQTKANTSAKSTKKVKLTKADAARKTKVNQKSPPKQKPLQKKSESTTVKKPTPQPLRSEEKHSSIPQNETKEKITIEQVMKETQQENDFLPQTIKSSENTVFTDSLSDDLSSVYARTSHDLPEPPGKYTLEFSCKTAPELLYKFLTDPIELSEWFCDDVNIRNGIYTFVWNGVPQQARLVKQERNTLVRFQWIDKNDGSYFEFNIHKNPLTGDVMLYVTDFSEPNELESNKLWWNTQINKLKTILGLQY